MVAGVAAGTFLSFSQGGVCWYLAIIKVKGSWKCHVNEKDALKMSSCEFKWMVWRCQEVAMNIAMHVKCKKVSCEMQESAMRMQERRKKEWRWLMEILHADFFFPPTPFAFIYL